MGKNKYKVIHEDWNGPEEMKEILEKKEEKGWLFVSFNIFYHQLVIVFKKKSE